MEGDLYQWIDIIRQYGYIALFVMIVVGLFIFPVPNEVLLMGGGLLSTTKWVDPVPTFIILLLSIMTHGTILYVIGYIVQQTWTGKDETSVWYQRAQKGKELLEQYGLKAAAFSYFFPFIRHAVPFSIGMSNIKYQWFALISFSSATIWLFLYFWIGFYFGRSITDWTSFIYSIIFIMVLLVIPVGAVQIMKAKKLTIKKKLR